MMDMALKPTERACNAGLMKEKRVLGGMCLGFTLFV